MALVQQGGGGGGGGGIGGRVFKVVSAADPVDELEAELRQRGKVSLLYGAVSLLHRNHVPVRPVLPQIIRVTSV
jgi:hypothetical protein